MSALARDAALLAIKPHVAETDIVVAVYQSCFDWLALAPRDLNYVATGAMGQAVSHGLGLALTQPDRRVFVFDGDGSLLMNLGALVSVADAGVENLVHVVFVNGVYEVNGAHPLPAADRVDFAAIARGAGYARAERVSQLDRLEALLPEMLAQPGPMLLALDVVPGATYPMAFDYIHSAEARERFRTAVNRPLRA